MWAILILAAVGFSLGYFLDIPYHALDSKYLALIFLALLDASTFSLSRDLTGSPQLARHVITRLLVLLVFGGFVIYFGEKSHIDLYLVALLPVALGLGLNLYKFLPK